MISFYSLCFIALINLFTLGIKYISTNFLLFEEILPFNKKLNISSNYALRNFLGLLFYCIISNLILLAPSIIFFINKEFTNFQIIIKTSINITRILFLLISLTGLINIIYMKNPFKNNNNKLSSSSYDKNLILGLLLSTLIYILISPKTIDSGLFSDTGLYHLPFINHISRYTIEPGLANLHFRYGFYGLSFFGQVPIQSFFKGNFLSPSLSIGFMGIYFAYFGNYIKYLNFRNIYKVLKGKFIFTESIQDISLLYFLLSIIFYTGNIFSSLSSYKLDLPLFICGSFTFHLCLISIFDNQKIYYYIPIFWLSLFSPILKLTGITTTFFSLLFILINQINAVNLKCKNKKITLIYKYTISRLINIIKNLNFLKNYLNLKLTILLIIFILSIFLITNIVITGYPIFPNNLIGPLHNYSINSDLVESLKVNTLNWHRYQNNSIESKYWFLYFLFTRNGNLILSIWFMPSLLTCIFIRYIKKISPNSLYQIKLFRFFIPLIILQLFCFFKLIPLYNYYPWISHCSIFILLISFNRLINIKNMKINFLKITSYLLITFIVLNSFFSYSNRKIIANIPNSFIREPIIRSLDYVEFEIIPRKWISLGNLSSNKKVKVRIPKNSDQCWGISPPCTVNKKQLEDL